MFPIFVAKSTIAPEFFLFFFKRELHQHETILLLNFNLIQTIISFYLIQSEGDLNNFKIKWIFRNIDLVLSTKERRQKAIVDQNLHFI